MLTGELARGAPGDPGAGGLAAAFGADRCLRRPPWPPSADGTKATLPRVTTTPFGPALDLPAEVPGSLLGMAYFLTPSISVSGKP